MADKTRNAWDARQYEKLASFEGDWRDLWWNQDYLELLARRWHFHQVRRLLDVGCGVGHWGQRLATVLPQTTEIVGCDWEAGFEAKALERARERNLQSRYQFKAAPAEALPFAEDSFDVVTAQTVLMHVAEAKVSMKEMIRVLRPGGLLILVEPNNMASSLSLNSSAPRRSWADVLELLAFQSLCEQGKQALGKGDSSVGDLLPGYCRELGLHEIQVYNNDKCAALVPPYDTRAEQLDISTVRQLIEQDVCIDVGPMEDARRRFLAGGGTESAFSTGWERALRHQRGMLAAIDAGEYHGARGFMLYAISARKPRREPASRA
jgi:ubiquinone/menaquinone biosynthesis C-methylase UbiE